jgi:hypothetical protein
LALLGWHPNEKHKAANLDVPAATAVR